MALNGIDHIDRNILKILQIDGRIRLNELAAQVALTGPAVRERMRRLEKLGYIMGYRAEINTKKLNLPISAMVRVYSDEPDCALVAKKILEIDGVHECMRISGPETAVVIIHARDPAEFEIILAKISKLGRTESNLVLDRKENTFSL